MFRLINRKNTPKGFVKVDGSYFININSIYRVFCNDDGSPGSVIHTTKGDLFFDKRTPDEIMVLIKNAQ